MAKILGLSFVFSLLMAANLAAFLSDPKIDMKMGTIYGFLTGFGWVALGMAIIALFERRSWKYMVINGGYMSGVHDHGVDHRVMEVSATAIQQHSSGEVHSKS
jgi:hypothetical protein